ncbi:hypothetical protein [Roseibacillus persicicus]|uniref:hypothetical protein n=1 Tax=Roseibacillus persicicus TaxID=454148 RepID=UPI00280F476A|nr:hypothetical protein [Roseibacillus persicicus]MDQ8191685.1 hypothetical protein [Roseibacillus persicicus]
MTKKTSFPTENVDRISARLSLTLAALIPLVAIGLTHFYSENYGKKKSSQTTSAKNYGSDSRLAEFCSKNVKDNRAFVLFKYGTCVVIEGKKDTATIKNEALRILSKTATPDARFVCTPVEDNNLIVSYTEPVFHLRFGEDMNNNREQIESDFRRFLTESELADITPSWEPPFHAKVGLRSRARLLKDAQNPVISHIIAPRGTEKTSASETASVSF